MYNFGQAPLESVRLTLCSVMAVAEQLALEGRRKSGRLERGSIANRDIPNASNVA